MRRDREEMRPVMVAPARYVRIGPIAEAATGIPVASMDKKIERREWIQGREWIKGPDHRRYLDLHAFEAWVELGRKESGDDTDR